MLRYLTPSRTRNVSRFRFGRMTTRLMTAQFVGAGDGALLDPLEDTLRLPFPIGRRRQARRGQASNSSTVRGQSSFSSRESERSARTRPSVWQRGQ
jgi:hypothetical protein